MKRAKKAPEHPAAPQPFHNPFARLEGLKGDLPSGSIPAEGGTEPISPWRAVVRLERKGRRGKEVTVVEQLQLDAAELARWLKEFKQSLGCGGTVEGGALVFQGDQRQRLKAALLARGVRRIAGV